LIVSPAPPIIYLLSEVTVNAVIKIEDESNAKMSLDGGKVRLRTEKKGEGSHWKENPRNLH